MTASESAALILQLTRELATWKLIAQQAIEQAAELDRKLRRKEAA